MSTARSTARTRPAETAATFGALVTATAYAIGLSAEWIAVAGILAGLAPGAVTFIVANGGVREVAARLWRGARA
ncbi:hypothetical protein [Paraconexibacter algicola]|uniref:Uncharacterized protein n=1 Tax=Paraconexibacter algicola TaxID=2133960 RepID=A0A2T4UE36_9ACTN|nr:hypothetical protein [Paraconexibacter algicola]PTL55761.1 hypothetical protein C7Y72_19220 [Paraconexibacter algicola]